MSNAQVNFIKKLGSSIGVDDGGLIVPANMPGVIVLSAYVGAATANNFLAFYKWGTNGGVQYSVPGANLEIIGIQAYMAGVQAATFGYGTAALVAADTATAPAGAQYFSAGTTIASRVFPAADSYMPLKMDFPSGAFPFVQTIATGTYNLILIGIES